MLLGVRATSTNEAVSTMSRTTFTIDHCSVVGTRPRTPCRGWQVASIFPEWKAGTELAAEARYVFHPLRWSLAQRQRRRRNTTGSILCRNGVKSHFWGRIHVRHASGNLFRLPTAVASSPRTGFGPRCRTFPYGCSPPGCLHAWVTQQHTPSM